MCCVLRGDHADRGADWCLLGPRCCDRFGGPLQVCYVRQHRLLARGLEPGAVRSLSLETLPMTRPCLPMTHHCGQGGRGAWEDASRPESRSFSFFFSLFFSSFFSLFFSFFFFLCCLSLTPGICLVLLPPTPSYPAHGLYDEDTTAPSPPTRRGASRTTTTSTRRSTLATISPGPTG